MAFVASITFVSLFAHKASKSLITFEPTLARKAGRSDGTEYAAVSFEAYCARRSWMALRNKKC